MRFDSHRSSQLFAAATCQLFLMNMVGCTGLVPGALPPPASLESIHHIIFLAQENRSFDHYFGAPREYWAQNRFPDQVFDGLPQFNMPAGADKSRLRSQLAAAPRLPAQPGESHCLIPSEYGMH